MTKKITPSEKQAVTVSAGADSPFLLYAGDDEKVHVRALIHAEGELDESATAEDFSVVQNEGGAPSGVRSVTTLRHYSLDAIIAGLT